MKTFLISMFAVLACVPPIAHARDFQRSQIQDSSPVVMPAKKWVEIPGGERGATLAAQTAEAAQDLVLVVAATERGVAATAAIPTQYQCTM